MGQLGHWDSSRIIKASSPLNLSQWTGTAGTELGQNSVLVIFWLGQKWLILGQEPPILGQFALKLGQFLMII